MTLTKKNITTATGTNLISDINITDAVDKTMFNSTKANFKITTPTIISTAICKIFCNFNFIKNQLLFVKFIIYKTDFSKDL